MSITHLCDIVIALLIGGLVGGIVGIFLGMKIVEEAWTKETQGSGRR